MTSLSRVYRLSFFALLTAASLAGCMSVFSTGSAREVSREKLLALADTGAGDHIRYMGSDRDYHYVFDERADRHKSYKVRASTIELKDTFNVGDDSYVLWPWLIEGKLLGSKPEEPQGNEKP